MAWKGNSSNPVPNFIQQSATVGSEKVGEINRAEQIKRRDTDEQKDFTVKLIDIDTAIMKHIEKLQITVVDNGNNIKVPLYYASPEKWKSIQKDGIIRDYNGKMILPAVVFKRVNSEKDTAMMMFNRYLNYPVMKKYSEKNRYTQFNLLVPQNAPINEVYDVLCPDHMVFTYHFIIWTEYVEQMNSVVERFNFETDDYWGEKHGFRFRTKIDSFSHTIELQVDQDRMVKTEFDLMVHGYLLPDTNYSLDGRNKPTTQKWFTAKKIVMGIETVATDFDWSDSDKNKEKWRKQAYPNLQKDVEIPAPPVVPAPIIDTRKGNVPIAGIWTYPAPENSNSPGTIGQISKDDDYYYIFMTDNKWKRAPKVQVNSLSTIVGEKKWLSFDNDYIYVLGDLYRIPMSLFNIF